MATYNGARYLKEQLQSLSAQKLPPFELIVTDDRSTDATPDIIAEFAASAPFPVRFFRNPKQLGFANNFLHASTLATGDMIAFCDQDDVWLPDKLSECGNALSEPDTLLCVHSSATWHGGQNFSGNWPDFKTHSRLSPGESDPLAAYPGLAMVLRRELLQIMDFSIRPTNIHSIKAMKFTPAAHDQWVWILASVFGKIVQLPNVLTHYRQHGSKVYGGSDQKSIKRKILLTIGENNYAEFSELATEYAGFLLQAAKKLPADRAELALAAAARLERKAGFLATRGGIYTKKSTFFSRSGAFLKLIFGSGYADDKGNTTLGRKALMKDGIFGVPAGYRLLPK